MYLKCLAYKNLAWIAKEQVLQKDTYLRSKQLHKKNDVTEVSIFVTENYPFY